MLLAIDVGNTNIVFGVFDEDKLLGNWRIATIKERTNDEYGMLFTNILSLHSIANKDISNAIISSVVPPLMHTLPNSIRKYFKIEPIIVGPGTKTGINIKYDNPKEVGADRIVNAVAGYEKYGAPLILVDMGTAITFCYISKGGNYEGGLIMPGVQISADALFTRTAKLPKIEILETDKIIGTTTVESIQAGLYHGIAGTIDYIIEKIIEEQKLNKDEVKVISTGGFARMFEPKSKYIQKVDRLITLEGLNMIYKKNIKK
ncbi:MAG: type III pantothenate kinase [Tissierellia bacterium]|nr:type III pantothenate kinase [Tissierellia bacterium]